MQPPPWLSAQAQGDGTVDLQWGASPTAASRDVGYVVLRRQVGASSFLEVARTTAVSFTDSPTPGTFEYVVRAMISTFSSADSPLTTAGP